jgi:hypothetical protein
LETIEREGQKFGGLQQTDASSIRLLSDPPDYFQVKWRRRSVRIYPNLLLLGVFISSGPMGNILKAR